MLHQQYLEKAIISLREAQVQECTDPAISARIDDRIDTITDIIEEP